ncbi:hypothetical protein EON83_20405 [bacterium]|nr:MAG: hypothetical protein EON83_20405 [bacterium]
MKIKIEMKKLLSFIIPSTLLLGLISTGHGDKAKTRKPPGEHPVKGYYRKDGTYVRPHTAGHGPLADKESSGSSGGSGSGTSNSFLFEPSATPTPRPAIGGNWTLPRPSPSVSNVIPAKLSATQEAYLEQVRKLAKEAQIRHFLVESGVHKYRTNTEVWGRVAVLDDVSDVRISDSDPASPRMDLAQKAILNNLLTLEEIAGSISSIDPVPASCADIDQNLQKYGQSAIDAIKQIKEAINSEDAEQLSQGEDALSDSLIYLDEATTDIRKHLIGSSPKKTYVPG